MAHIRQSRPHSGLGFKVEVLQIFRVFASSLGSGSPVLKYFSLLQESDYDCCAPRGRVVEHLHLTPWHGRPRISQHGFLNPSPHNRLIRDFLNGPEVDNQQILRWATPYRHRGDPTDKATKSHLDLSVCSLCSSLCVFRHMICTLPARCFNIFPQQVGLCYMVAAAKLGLNYWCSPRPSKYIFRNKLRPHLYQYAQ